MDLLKLDDNVIVDNIFMIADLVEDKVYICRPNESKVSWSEIEELMESVIDNTGDHEHHLNEENDLLVYEFSSGIIANEVYDQILIDAKEHRLITKIADNGDKKITYLLFK